jgi:hypothetical protein
MKDFFRIALSTPKQFAFVIRNCTDFASILDLLRLRNSRVSLLISQPRAPTRDLGIMP